MVVQGARRASVVCMHAGVRGCLGLEELLIEVREVGAAGASEAEGVRSEARTQGQGNKQVFGVFTTLPQCLGLASTRVLFSFCRVLFCLNPRDGHFLSLLILLGLSLRRAIGPVVSPRACV